MKRIVDGLTYNTDTSTLLAKAEWEFNNQFSPYYGAECGGQLYQTRGGAFFLVTTIHVKDDDGELRDKVEFAAMTAERAQALLTAQRQLAEARLVEARLERYQKQEPFRTTAGAAQKWEPPPG